VWTQSFFGVFPFAIECFLHLNTNKMTALKMLGV
jgi:hypothetical protein